jgi:hypothetical protein
MNHAKPWVFRDIQDFNITKRIYKIRLKASPERTVSDSPRGESPFNSRIANRRREGVFHSKPTPRQFKEWFA